MTAPQTIVGEVGADESRASRDQDLHVGSRPFRSRGVVPHLLTEPTTKSRDVSSKGSSTTRAEAHYRRDAHAHMREGAYSDMRSFSDEQVDLIAARSRALGDGTRIRILSVLARGEQPVGQIAEAAGTQQSTASKHLQVLFHAGLVHRRRAATTVLYTISSGDLLRWLRYLGGRRDMPSAVRSRIGSVRGVTAGATARRVRK